MSTEKKVPIYEDLAIIINVYIEGELVFVRRNLKKGVGVIFKVIEDGDENRYTVKFADGSVKKNFRSSDLSSLD